MGRITPGTGAVTLTGQAVGGDLSGNWPSLSYGTGTITNADIDPAAGIARTKFAAVEARHVLGATGEPTLASGWSQYEPVSFWLDPASELVRFEGVLKRTGAYTSGTTIFTMPTGYRPTGAVNRYLTTSKIVSSFSITNISVGPSGIVFVNEALVDQTFIYMDGTSFRP